MPRTTNVTTNEWEASKPEKTRGFGGGAMAPVPGGALLRYTRET
jgi:hypothetical protein